MHGWLLVTHFLFMITVLILTYAKLIWNWIKSNPFLPILFLCIIVALLFTFCREEKRPDVKIVVPHEAIEKLQTERDKKLESLLSDVDKRREALDRKVLEASKTPTPKRNVTAKELEEKAK